MLTNETKRQIFMKLRTENYVASLRLEGLLERTLVQSHAAGVVPMPAAPAKHEAKKHVR
jgi:predicted DNA-binding transcriptional regulator